MSSLNHWVHLSPQVIETTYRLYHVWLIESLTGIATRFQTDKSGNWVEDLWWKYSSFLRLRDFVLDWKNYIINMESMLLSTRYNLWTILAWSFGRLLTTFQAYCLTRWPAAEAFNRWGLLLNYLVKKKKTFLWQTDWLYEYRVNGWLIEKSTVPLMVHF